jgi:hypothetical protein
MSGRFMAYSYFLFFCVCVGGWDLNSGFCSCMAGTLLLEPDLPVHFSLFILEMGSFKLFI